MKRLVHLLGMGFIVACGAVGTSEAGFFEGRIVPHFTSPSLRGYVAGSGGYDNVHSARYSIFGSDSVASIQWGSGGFSQANFFANQNVSTPGNTTFTFGTLTFFNGTSSLESLIFGATLVLEFIPTGSTQVVDTLYLGLGIGTTLNGRGAREDSDYISISGLDRSAFVAEGLGATFILSGHISENGAPNSISLFSVDNPDLVPTDIELDPDSITRLDPNDPTQLETLNFPGSGIGRLVGFTGATPIPEPSTLALLAIGALTAVTSGRFRGRRKPAA